jgi:hypothetical protein
MNLTTKFPAGSGISYPYVPPLYRYSSVGAFDLTYVNDAFLQPGIYSPAGTKVGFSAIPGCNVQGSYSTSRDANFDCGTKLTDCSRQVYMAATYDIVYNSQTLKCETALRIFVFVSYKKSGSCLFFPDGISASAVGSLLPPGYSVIRETMLMEHNWFCSSVFFDSFFRTENNIRTCFATEMYGPFVEFGLDKNGFTMSWMITE